MAIYHITITLNGAKIHQERLDSFQIPLATRMADLEKQFPKDKGNKITVLKEDKEEWDWLA